MIETLVETASVLPSEAVYTYASTKMLDMRRVVVFWVLRMSFCIVMMLFRSQLDLVVRTILGVFAYLVMPLLFSQGNLPRRMLSVVSMYVVVMIAEMTCTVLWLALMKAPLPDILQLDLVEYWMLRLLHLLIISALFMALYAFSHHIDGSLGDGAVKLVSALLAIQVVLLSVCTGTLEFVPGEKELLGTASLSLGAACVVVDGYLLVVIRRYEERMAQQQRIEILQAQLDDYLARYGEVAASIEEIARLRHDVRNQLQVINDLAQRGERGQAREMLGILIDACESSGARAAGAQDDLKVAAANGEHPKGVRP